MKHLSLATIVCGLICGGLSAYPVWNEQKMRLEDTNSTCNINYESLVDCPLLIALIKNPEGSMWEKLRKKSESMDNDYMEFLPNIQSLKKLDDLVDVPGEFVEILGYNKISGVTSIYIYQILFTKKGEDTNVGFDEYVQSMFSASPFDDENDNKIFS